MSSRTKIILGIVGVALVAYIVCVFDMPYKKVGDSLDTVPTDTTAETIHVTTPQSGAAITSPVSISGQARGSWFFEASFPVNIIDDAGNVLGYGHVDAKDNWMTNDFVPFTATISFALGKNAPTTGVVRLMRDNPSGDPARDAHIDIPVIFGHTTSTTTASTTKP